MDTLDTTPQNEHIKLSTPLVNLQQIKVDSIRQIRNRMGYSIQYENFSCLNESDTSKTKDKKFVTELKISDEKKKTEKE